jgi:DNA-binding response OmpR family regulator
LLVHRILVVEDDPRTADAIKLYLEHDGFDARVAADGLAALESCRATVPDLVILDRMLPHLIATVFGAGYKWIGWRRED